MANADVGKLWHVGLDDAGYMLRPQEGAEYRRATLRLDSAAQRTQSNQFIFDQYVSRRQRDWSGGAGQEHEGTDLSLPTRFYSTDGKIDPFTEKPKLILFKEWDEVSSTATAVEDYANVFFTDFDNIWAKSAASEEYVFLSTIDDGTPQVTTGLAALFAASSPSDACSDGSRAIFVGLNNASSGVEARYLTNDPTASPVAWATALVAGSATSWGRIDHVGDRFAAVYVLSGTQRWGTLDEDGAEETAGGKIAFPSSAPITNTVLGDGHLWFGVSLGPQESYIYSWQIGSSDAPRVATELPANAGFTTGVGGARTWKPLYWDNGILYVATYNGVGSSWVFRCAHDGNGGLQYEIVTETPDSGQNAQWGSNSSLIYATLNDTLLVIDPSTGGWAYRSLPTGGDAGNLLTIQGGDTILSSNGDFFSLSDDHYATGTLYGSFTDHGTLVPKAFDEIRALGVVPTGSDIDIAVGYGTDNESPTWTDLGDLNPSETEAVLPAPAALTADFPQWNYRVILHRGTTTTQTAELHAIELRHHIRGLSDEIIQLPIDCTDHIELANGSPHRGNGKGAGRARLAALRALVGTRVGFQDLDYLSSGSEEEVEVVSVDTAQVQIGERRPVGGQFPELIAVVTLRKVG